MDNGNLLAPRALPQCRRRRTRTGTTRNSSAAAMAHSLTAVLPQLASAASSSSSSSCSSSSSFSSSSSPSPGNHFFSLSSSLLSRMPAVAWSFSKASSFTGLSIHEAAVAAAIVTGHGNSQQLRCGGVSRVRGSEKSDGFRCRAAAAATAAEAPVVSSNGAAGVSASSPEKLFGRQYFPLSAIVGQV